MTSGMRRKKKKKETPSCTTGAIAIPFPLCSHVVRRQTVNLLRLLFIYVLFSIIYIFFNFVFLKKRFRVSSVLCFSVSACLNLKK